MTPPHVLAELDQAHAQLNARVDSLTETFRRLRDRRGGVQATADMTVLLAVDFSHEETAALAAVAIDRLAGKQLPVPTPGRHHGSLVSPRHPGVGAGMPRHGEVPVLPLGLEWDTYVWIAVPRKDVPAHRLGPWVDGRGWTSTGCDRSTSTGLLIPALEAVAQYAASWCRRCWPSSTQDGG